MIKLILGRGQLLIERLLVFNAMAASFEEFPFHRDPSCPMCGEDPSINELMDYQAFCDLEQHEMIRKGEAVRDIRVMDLEQKLENGEYLTFLDVREEWERSIYPFSKGIKVPYSQLAFQWESLLSHKDEDLVVCCLFGWKSQEAIRFLKERGFKNLWNLVGGLEYWYLHQEQSGKKAPGET